MSEKEQKSLEERVAALEAKVASLESELSKKASNESVNREISRARSAAKGHRH